MGLLKIGDTIWYKGNFGKAKKVKAKVTAIEWTNGGKYGEPCDKVHWRWVQNRNVVVDLDNGFWAYAYQISKIN